MSPKHLSCLCCWAVVVTPTGMFTNHGTFSPFEGLASVEEHPLYIRDRALHKRRGDMPVTA